MENNRIGTGLELLDNIMSGGYKKGELTLFTGSTNLGKSNFMERATRILAEMRENMDMQGIVFGKRSSITKHEKLGDVIFPVTYFDNGLVIVDYPDKTFNA